MDKLDFSRRLKAIRMSAGLSQEQLAERIDRSVDTVSAIERGKSFPNYETLSRIASALGLTVPVLLNEAGHETTVERASLLAEINVLIAPVSDVRLRLIRDLVRAVGNSDVRD